MSADQPDYYQQSVAISIICLNSLSMLSLLFVLGVYVTNWKSISSFPMRLSFYLCVSCLAQNLTVLLLNPITLHSLQTENNDKVSSFCIFQGVLKVSFDLSSIIWTTFIIYSTYASIVLRSRIQKMQIPYIIIGFAIPVFVACILIFFGVYQWNVYYCWFEGDFTTEGFWLRIGFFFGPLWVLFGVNFGLAACTYRKLVTLQLPEQILNTFKRIMLFPFIIFVTGVFATVDLFYNYIQKRDLSWLDYVGIFFLNLYGFFNSIAYGLNPAIRERIVMCFRKDSPHLSYQSSRDEGALRTTRNSEQIQAQLLQMTAMKKLKPQQIKRQTQL